MTFGVQTQSTVTITALSLFATEGKEMQAEESIETLLPDGQGGLKTNSKQYTLVPLRTIASAKETREYVEFFGPRTANQSPSLGRPSLMHIASTTPHSPLQSLKGEVKPHTSLPQSFKAAEGKSETLSQSKGTQPQLHTAKHIAQA